jgi:predicted AlkP superfamily pyrophosphatase or phosphodiesterase
MNTKRHTLDIGLISGSVALALALADAAMAAGPAEAPRLIVSVSVDQFCQDYLIRFHDNFADDGLLARVRQDGASYPNCHHRHAYTVTAPGHAVQMTGADPGTNGIIGNDWYDRASGKNRYCVADSDVEVVGISEGKPMSPKNLLVDTVGDMLKGATGGKGKVIGVAIKDRAAILMSGRRADAAYWLEKNKWVTSTYYRSDLPGYLRVLNEQDAISQYAGESWSLSLPADRYHNGPDDGKFENPPTNFTNQFPHTLAKAGELAADKFGDQVLFSPFGNDYTLLAAREIIEGESLGADNATDILTINFSSNDYVGHAFGPYSLEVEDMTYRTDRQLGEFARWLDQRIGAGRWTMTLTADHGVCPIPELAAQSHLPAKRNPLGPLDQVQPKLEAELRKSIEVEPDQESLVVKVDEHQVFLREGHPKLAGENWEFAQRLVRDWLIRQPYVAYARTREDLLASSSDKLDTMLRRSFHPGMSGDVVYVLTPYCITGGLGKGTTHGSPWHYDTNVPMLLVGNGIENGVFHRRVSPACVASTVARLVGVNAPAANAEEPLSEALGP